MILVRADVRAATAALAATTTVGLLLRRMRGEFEATGELTVPTTVAMYACYAGHAAGTALAARNRIGALELASGPATGAGGVLVAGGTGLCLAGMRRFAGPEQISGTAVGALATGGVYRYTRNPQYVGYVAFLAGIGLARQSAAVLGSAGAVGVVFGAWVPVEERHLIRAFGQQYRHYCEQVPRWFGPPRG